MNVSKPYMFKSYMYHSYGAHKPDLQPFPRFGDTSVPQSLALIDFIVMPR